MLSFSQYLTEGRFDPGILKCVFMAGGPGSGKSFVAAELFGITPQFKSTFSHFGLKSVNSDHAFEYLLGKQGINPADLATNDALFKRATVGPDSPRERAKALTAAQLRHYMNGKLGLILDGTGDDVGKILNKMREAHAAGYDCYMVFVNTSLDTALSRNAARARKLPDLLVQEIWSKAQENRQHFKRIFGANFTEVDNEADSVQHLRGEVAQRIAAFIRQPVQNPIGREWMADLDALAGQSR